MITVHSDTAAGAAEGAVGKCELLPVPAGAAGLAGTGRVHADHSPTGTCRLVGEIVRELRPCRVTDALGQAVVVHHAVDGQVFNRDYFEPVDDRS